MQTPTDHTSHSSPSSHAPLPDAPPSIHPLIHPSIAPAPVPLSALTELLGATRSTVRHFADRLGFRFFAHRIGARREPCACLTAEQAVAITAAHQADLIAHPPAPKPEPAPINRDLGYFYLIQLEPEHDPGRFRLGFTTDLEGRLADFLTIAPPAKLIAAWPAHRSWEHTAIVATSQSATPLSQEVFRCENLEDALANANRFFAAMPQPAPSPPLSPSLNLSLSPTPPPPHPHPHPHPQSPAAAPHTRPISPKGPISPISPISPTPIPASTAPPRAASPAAQPLWTACGSPPLWNRAPDG